MKARTEIEVANKWQSSFTQKDWSEILYKYIFELNNVTPTEHILHIFRKEVISPWWRALNYRDKFETSVGNISHEKRFQTWYSQKEVLDKQPEINPRKLAEIVLEKHCPFGHLDSDGQKKTFQSILDAMVEFKKSQPDLIGKLKEAEKLLNYLLEYNMCSVSADERIREFLQQLTIPENQDKK